MQQSKKHAKSRANQSIDKIVKTLRAIWLLSPSCKKGFLHSRRLGAAASFRYVARMIIACLTWSRLSFTRREEEHRSVLSFMHTDSSSRNLLFDALMYKADKELSIHQEIKRILSLPPCEKSSKDIQLALIALREIPSFAEYPTPMQRQMCKMGWYQRVESKRVIIQEGQEACNFYFILSGTVVITEWNDLIKSSQTKCMLQRGMNFGEHAVLKQTYRSATVVSHVTTELLCLDAHDLRAMYICGREAPIQDEKILSFLRSCYFLQDFPLDLLQTQPQFLIFHYFLKGQVLVKNSHYSDWLYIVKSGNLSVLKRLQPTEPDSTSNERGRLPELAHGKSVVVNKSYTEMLQKLLASRDRSSVIDMYYRQKKRKISQARAPCMRRVASRHVDSTNPGNVHTSTSHLPPLVEDRLSIGARLDAARHYSASTAAGREDAAKPTFITVRKLEKGQSFGLASEVFTDQPSLSLVSNGADCLLLSKPFFFKYCSERTLSTLLNQELPYPTDEDLQGKLQAYLNWLKFKDKYYSQVTNKRTKFSYSSLKD